MYHDQCIPYTITTTTTTTTTRLRTFTPTPISPAPLTPTTPRSPSCSPLSALPIEIWLNILPFLPTATIQSLSLTSSLFRSLAQPLLFTTLDISPFFLTYSTTRPILRPKPYLDRTKDRVALYQQPHIAHAVHHVWVSPYSRRGFPLRNNRDDLDPAHLIQIIIDALPSFPNLHSLSWHCTDFKPEWWAVIAKLPLQRLWLNSCTVKSLAPGIPPTPLSSVTRLDLDHWAWEGQVTNHISIHEERSNGVDASMLPLVANPHSITSISVPRIDTALRLLIAIEKLFPPSSTLQSLTLPFPALASAMFVPALRRCHNLLNLRLLPPMDVSSPQQDFPLGPLPRDCIPNLRSFEGPYTRLMDFAVHRQIQDLILWGFDDLPAQCDASALVDTLHVLSSMHTERKAVRVLKVAMLTITVSFMRCLELFDNLREVSVESLDGPLRSGLGGASPSQLNYPFEFDSKSPISLLLCILRDIKLPPHLMDLTIHTRLNSGDQDSAQQKTIVALFMERLAARHAALCKVEIGWGVYWTGMFIAAWGRMHNTNCAMQEQATKALHDPELLAAHDDKIKSMLLTSQVDDTERDSLDSGYHSIQSSLASCLDSYPSQRSIVTQAVLPLGKLTFTEHRRRTTAAMCPTSGGSWMHVGMGEVRKDRWFQKWATRLRGAMKRYLRI